MLIYPWLAVFNTSSVLLYYSIDIYSHDTRIFRYDTQVPDTFTNVVRHLIYEEIHVYDRNIKSRKKKCNVSQNE